MTTTPLPPWKFERVIDGIPCVPTVEAEHNMQAYAIQARADLEAENQRLRDVLRQAESKLVELEHAVGGGDDEIYVEGVILSIRAALGKQP